MIENGPTPRPSLPEFEPPPPLPFPATRPAMLAVGIGCGRGADPAEALAQLRAALAEAGLAQGAVAVVASVEEKAGEPAVLETASVLGVPARFFDAGRLEAEAPRLATPSEAVFRRTGCHGVAEGAALAAAGTGASLVVPKRRSARVTLAVAMAAAMTAPPAETDKAAGTAAEETR